MGTEFASFLSDGSMLYKIRLRRSEFDDSVYDIDTGSQHDVIVSDKVAGFDILTIGDR